MKSEAADTERILQLLRYERRRQVDYGWGNKDDEHTNGELIDAANSYAEVARKQVATRSYDFVKPILQRTNGQPNYYIEPGGCNQGYNKGFSTQPAPHTWPFNKNMWVPRYPRDNLIKAGALIIAELERLERLDKSLLQRKVKRKKKGPSEQEPMLSMGITSPTHAMQYNPINATTWASNVLINSNSYTQLAGAASGGTNTATQATSALI